MRPPSGRTIRAGCSKSTWRRRRVGTTLCLGCFRPRASTCGRFSGWTGNPAPAATVCGIIRRRTSSADCGGARNVSAAFCWSSTTSFPPRRSCAGRFSTGFHCRRKWPQSRRQEPWTFFSVRRTGPWSSRWPTWRRRRRSNCCSRTTRRSRTPNGRRRKTSRTCWTFVRSTCGPFRPCWMIPTRRMRVPTFRWKRHFGRICGKPSRMRWRITGKGAGRPRRFGP